MRAGTTMKLSGKDRALLISHRLHRGLYARVAKRLGVDRSYWIVWRAERGNLTQSCVRCWRNCAGFSRETSEVRYPTKL